MRNAFVNALTEVALKDPRVMLLTGDLGYNALEPFFKVLPERFLNMGVAEQHMMAFAAGLALSGKIPVVYSIATFATLRAYEQIRNDICYQNLNVKIVGAGAGLTYSQYGATHHAMEDIGIMRVLPRMTIIAPGDPLEVDGAVRAMLAHDGPCYLRIGSRGEPNVHAEPFKFRIGKGFVLREGSSEVALIATGNMLETANKAVELLAARGISARLISMPTVKPIDEAILLDTAAKFRYVFTIEEHGVIGGLGSAVAEFLAERGTPARLTRIAATDAFQPVGGCLAYVRGLNGLTPEHIAERVEKEVRRKK